MADESFTLMVKLPASSVLVDVTVPFSATVAPAIAAPLLSVTLPLIGTKNGLKNGSGNLSLIGSVGRPDIPSLIGSVSRPDIPSLISSVSRPDDASLIGSSYSPDDRSMFKLLDRSADCF